MPLAIPGLSGSLFALYDTTLTSTSTTLDTGAGGLSAQYAHLLLVAYIRTDQAGTIISSATITLNADSGSNYDYQRVYGRDTTSTTSDGQAGTAPFICPGANAAAGVFGSSLGLIPAYAQTTGEKSIVAISGFADEASTGGDASLWQHHWRNTAAVSRVTLTAGAGSNFVAGSRFTVYGIGA